jgi:hypothetical protein
MHPLSTLQGDRQMKKIATSIIALALCAFAANAFAGATNIRISQMYSGGGGSTGTYIKDYVELFNPTGAAVNIGGWSLQYGSATGTVFGSATTNLFVFPANTTIQSCGYLLVECSSAGSAGAALPVTADLSTTNMSMSGTTGKLALVNISTGGNACSGNVSGGVFVDVVGWGTATCYETTLAAAPASTSHLLLRANGGLTDTDVNLADFTSVTTAGNPPRNSASVANPACLVTPASAQTWGRLKTIYR